MSLISAFFLNFCFIASLAPLPIPLKNTRLVTITSLFVFIANAYATPR